MKDEEYQKRKESMANLQKQVREAKELLEKKKQEVKDKRRDWERN